MRKRYRVLILAALVAALVVPVGYALSVESTPVAQARHTSALQSVAASVVPTAATSIIAAPSAMRSGAPSSSSLFYQVPDAAKLFGIGTVLLGLAAAVRKAI
jgi:hypothetical protein